MIDSNVLIAASKLKKAMDATYVVFRKEPSVEHATLWTAATTKFNDYCANTIKGLIEKDSEDRREEILANFEEYRICKQCGAKVLYRIDDNHFVEATDFVEDFPGWCYSCLVDHCINTGCAKCEVAANNSSCSFKYIKDIYVK